MLKQIGGELQQIAETITAIIGIDITIMDNNLERIAATGKLKCKIGGVAPRNSVFEKCLNTGKQYFIENPVMSEECYICDEKEKCDEKAEVCFPIIIDDQVEGVIGMIIFDEEAKSEFLEKQESYIDFDKRLCELIAEKIKAKHTSNKLQYKSTELLTVIDSVNEGIIILDKNNKIIIMNKYIKNKLKLNDLLTGKPITNLIPEAMINKIINNSYFIEEEQLNLTFKGVVFNALISSRAIYFKEEVEGSVITFKDFNKLQRSVFNISQNIAPLTFEYIIGSSAVLNNVKEQAKLIAKQNAPVLLLGDSGTGKELFARAIHNESERKNQIFMPINCGAIPESLVESELFGYEKGAFTGASGNGKMGKFEIAKDGTIFLDEIGDLPLHMQVKLLRVLEEKELMRVGGVKTIKVAPRIVAATNKDLFSMVAKKQFREDLFYRLNVIPINIPSLRERDRDVLELSKHFLDRYNKIYGRDFKGFTEGAKHILLNYSWPGNVRELQNLIEYSVNFEKNHFIVEQTLKARLGKEVVGINEEKGLKDMVEQYERSIVNKMIQTYGTTTEAKILIAKKLKISAATLYRKLEP